MRGEYQHNIDAKGRLFIPAKLREELGSTFYVTYGFNGGHKCLTAYTQEDWTAMNENYNRLSITQRSRLRVSLVMFAPILIISLPSTAKGKA